MRSHAILVALAATALISGSALAFRDAPSVHHADGSTPKGPPPGPCGDGRTPPPPPPPGAEPGFSPSSDGPVGDFADTRPPCEGGRGPAWHGMKPGGERTNRLERGSPPPSMR